jgi:hypothetical protein
VTLDVTVVVVKEDVETWHEEGMVSMMTSTEVMTAPLDAVSSVVDADVCDAQSVAGLVTVKVVAVL